MKNKFLIIGALVLIIIGVVIFFFFNNTSQNGTTSNYSANRTEAEINNNEASNTNSQDNAIARHNTEPIETEISSFSTPIMTQDANRQNNVELTCSSLNDTIDENVQTFSFCETLGPATTSEGYKKAEVFDAQRK